MILRIQSTTIRLAAMVVCIAFGGAVSSVQATELSATSEIQQAGEAELMLQRGDSLLALDKPVAALAMYRGAEERSFDPCQVARARIGIARIYVGSDNPDLAAEALRLADTGFLACEPEVRRTQVLLGSDLWIELSQESRAIEWVKRERALHAEDWELEAKLAHLWFTAGMWEEADAQYRLCLQKAPETTPLQRADWLSAVLQIQAIKGVALDDSISQVLETELTKLPLDVSQGIREQIHLVLTMEGMNVQALHWAQVILSNAGPIDFPQQAVAQLRIANSANDAHRPLEALIGFHEAIKAARKADDTPLLAEALRQKGLFEKERGNMEEALEAFLELDAIHTAALAAVPAASNRETRQFEEQVMPTLDPFDLAVLSAQQTPSSPYRSSGWPWIAGLLAIGVLAYARTQKQLKHALIRERRRIIRLRSLVPSDRLPSSTVASQPREIGTEGLEPDSELGETSLMPNGDLVFTQDNDPRSLSIQGFLDELDEELRSRIQCEVSDSHQRSIGPEVRVVIRNLLRGIIEISADPRPIELHVNADDNSHWTLSLKSHHTGTSKALEGLFYGKDAVASSRWNELHAQLRKLAGKINIERTSPLEERLTITLPYM